jgi:hypothetical protein
MNDSRDIMRGIHQISRDVGYLKRFIGSIREREYTPSHPYIRETQWETLPL